MSFSLILTHPGGSHKDEFLACCLLIAKHAAPLVRREPTPADLENPATAVVDVGGEHTPDSGNFDHHQFPKDHPPICALSLVLQHLGVYEDARAFCDWLEPAEWFDTRGPVDTARWLGVARETLFKLNSPIDTTLLRRFALVSELNPGEPLWEVMRWIGADLLDYLKNLRDRLDFIASVGEFWEIESPKGPFRVLFLPRTEPMPPMTITTKARIRMFSPMPTCTANNGPSMAPATAHKAAPMPNTPVNKRRMLMPMAMAISRFDAPARTQAPIRVCVTSR